MLFLGQNRIMSKFFKETNYGVLCFLISSMARRKKAASVVVIREWPSITVMLERMSDSPPLIRSSKNQLKFMREVIHP
jgi:hypothetical protein